MINRPAAAIATALTIFVLAQGAKAQEQTIKIGAVRSVSSVSVYTGIDKGWYKALGLNVEVEDLDASANVISLLATNRLQVVEGGISAGFFNGIEQKLPIVIATDRTSSPLSHKLLVRQDLQGKVNRISDLKGMRIASNANASVTSYEVGKILEADGVNLSQIDLKIIAFPLMGAAFKNGAIDAALVIQPWGSSLVDEKIAYLIADPDDYAQSAAADDCGHDHQYGMGQKRSGTDEEILRGLYARRARLLPCLSQRAEPARSGGTRGAHGADQGYRLHRKISVARSQHERRDERAKPARYSEILPSNRRR